VVGDVIPWVHKKWKRKGSYFFNRGKGGGKTKHSGGRTSSAKKLTFFGVFREGKTSFFERKKFSGAQRGPPRSQEEKAF